MATGGKKYALGTILHGLAGEIHRGEEIPATYKDLSGKEQPTDFERLEDLGLVSDKPVKDAAPELEDADDE